MWNPRKSKPTKESAMNTADNVANAAEDVIDAAKNTTIEDKSTKRALKGMWKGAAIALGSVAIVGGCAVAYVALRAGSKAVPALDAVADQAAESAIEAAGTVAEAFFK